VGTCGGTATSEVFVKIYEMLNGQFGILNFHAKHYKDIKVKLTWRLRTNSQWVGQKLGFTARSQFTEAHMVEKISTLCDPA
jgi:hypothetical protein